MLKIGVIMAKKKRKNNFIQRCVLRYRKWKRKKGKTTIKINKKLFAVAVVLLVILTILLNANSIHLRFKGYNKEERTILLQLDKSDLKEYLNAENSIDITSWNKQKNKQHYYDYEIYKKRYPKDGTKEIIKQVDTYYKLKPQLDKLGYTKKFCRDHYGIYKSDDYNILIEAKLSYSKTKKYIDTKGCQLIDMQAYLDSKKEPIDAILSITYPFLNSSNGYASSQIIKEPNNYEVLVKTGFTLPSDYEPEDLMEVDVPLNSEIEEAYLRKDAAKALNDMAKAAKKEGLKIGVDLAYVSYEEQEELYDHYMDEYGYAQASQMVAIPGTSEHQLGLGVDLTSQSVIDLESPSFELSEEYQWSIQHAHEYGYILRYPATKTGLTGVSNEPNHFRYVGKDVAKECFENDWTLEEYIQHHGFSYNVIKK